MDSSNINFNMNSKCEVFIEEDSSVYKSSIQDMGKGYIGISIPVCNGKYAPLSENQQVTVVYYDKNNLYGFNANVIGRKKDKIPIILLSMPEDIKKVQRRKFFRVNLLKEVEYLKADKNISDSTFNELIKNPKNFKKALMIDLSGGGLRLKTKEEIKLGDRFIIKIPLQQEEIFVIDDCVRVYKDTDSNLYVSGFSFVNIDTKVQDKIIAYLFWIMREQMKKI
ncbi:putative glycosyltransferase [Clostridium pasteurianum DSM 525 = ATCC 6013]|uniref:Putative glycosyltransferase n=1 Tax=Clostridium pasteurianum DSM 525 = ATCC 6013 TaxID=1262449 RepID=A0A0H3J7L3_CLOPA|nr:flagellar brake domain-containing protein [Clostridium pasteurianum]AJA47903.1 putative glycosyltransferase [Clostridium pasteurianum DSM 525 = ATCC 6013]AJA51891.1 putative glycosyltransferase [Clostridium pasteurianum DSM 525 = ATCC 6013]AOZ75193.1 glycosyltransferase [Clostridium pasteurianum DSM 525 = ATCC 6013]AOZ78988.1 glycosyltransferase [Clostridium pasteurianum]ELP59806.1 hypothetical protein F502_08073 [Clostridium pasteurianum DSM 525 = ATCC 6013]